MEYGILSLIPPILTVALAFFTRQVAMSLLIGVFVGSAILANGNVFSGFTDTFGYVISSLADPSHAAILIFTLTIAGMVELLSAMGGTQAIALKLSRKIKNARGAQLMISLLGCLVFFDDYANILIVGPTMRPLSDRLGVSREKLTYLVHTTAGIVSGVAVMTTWIGFEIGLVTDAYANMGFEINGFWMILKNIPYMFYNFFAIAISFLAAFMMRDFGPMYQAERRARLETKISAEAEGTKDDKGGEIGRKGKVAYAVIPICVMVLITFCGIWYSGYTSLEGAVSPFSFEGLRTCFGEADPMPAIVWAAAGSSLAAGLIAVSRAKFSLKKTYDVWLKGFLGLCEVGIIIVLAWSMGGIVSDIGTADYLISVLSGSIHGSVIPAIIFITACVISFSTGTSWGTMPIVFPIAIPLAAAFVEDPTASPVMLATIAAVLSGSIFGDQTSPISDSSILSSATSGCDLLQHVKTQIPYALVPAGLAVIGYLLAGLANVNAGIYLLFGVAAIAVILKVIGKSTRAEDLR